MSEGVTTKEKKEVLGKFMNTLRVSGYDYSYRRQLLVGVLKLRREEEKKIGRQEIDRFRSGAKIRADKKTKSGRYNNTWFLMGEYSSVLKVQATKDGELANVIRRKVGNNTMANGGKVKLVEKGGKSAMSGLKKGDPFWSGGCPYKHKCYAGEKVDCTRSRSIYEVLCGTCPDGRWDKGQATVYIGTSGHSLHKRLMEHQSAVRGQREDDSALSKHYHQVHNNCGDPDYQARIVGGSTKNLERYVGESLYIEKRHLTDGITVINGRGEWGRLALPRIGIFNQD